MQTLQKRRLSSIYQLPYYSHRENTMKNATLTLLCCCVLLSACDNTGETDTGIDAAGYDTGSASSDTGVSGGEAGKQAAVELEQALVKANETAEKPADSAQQLVDMIMKSAREHGDTAPQADDITIVLARRLPE